MKSCCCGCFKLSTTNLPHAIILKIKTTHTGKNFSLNSGNFQEKFCSGFHLWLLLNEFAVACCFLIFFCWWTREINTGIIVCGGQAAAHLHTRKVFCLSFQRSGRSLVRGSARHCFFASTQIFLTFFLIIFVFLTI